MEPFQFPTKIGTLSPTANAGTDQTLTLPALANLAGTATDDGVGGTTMTMTWSMVSGPGTVTFGTPITVWSSPNASAVAITAAFSVDGTYVVGLTVSDGTLTATDELTITVNPANQSPTADAGTDQTLTLPALANLAGTATDDGVGPTTLTTTWSMVSGPGTVTFLDASALTTTAAFSVDGTYVLRLTATDELTITVNPANQSPTANAGTDQTLTLPAVANLAGTATDDGVGGTTLTTTWSMVSGPGTVTFLDASALATTAAFSVDGTYLLRLTATDGTLTATDELTITVNPANQSPAANAGTDQTLTLPAVANLAGTATDDGVGGTTLTTTWSMVSGPGAVTFLDASALATTAAFSVDGIYVLRLTASDGTLTTTDEVTVTVDPAATGVSPSSVDVLISSGAITVGSYQVTITFDPSLVQVASVAGGDAPFSGFIVQAVDNITGSVTLNNFHISGRAGSFRIATLNFTPVQPGTVNLSTSGVTVTDVASGELSSSFLSLSATTLTVN